MARNTGATARLSFYPMPPLTAKRDQLFEQNRGLVHQIVKGYSNSAVPLEDMIQDGYCGLLRAAEKYDPSRGFRFSTYACWWIRSYINESFRCCAQRSMDEEISIDGGVTLHDILADEKAYNPENVIDARLQLESLIRRLRQFQLRQRQILVERLGLTADGKQSLQSIGDRIGLSRERVRQIEQKGLAALGINRTKRRKRKTAEQQ